MAAAHPGLSAAPAAGRQQAAAVGREAALEPQLRPGADGVAHRGKIADLCEAARASGWVKPALCREPPVLPRLQPK
eukprot:4831383-Pyramimonas_sp.AAC.1